MTTAGEIEKLRQEHLELFAEWRRVRAIWEESHANLLRAEKQATADRAHADWLLTLWFRAWQAYSQAQREFEHAQEETP